MRKVEFGEIATFSQGQQVSIPDQKTEKFDGCDTFLRIVNYTQNSDDFRYIPKQSHKHHVSTDDIIMVRYGAVGFVGRGLSGVLANNMFKINFDKDQVDGNYLFRTLWSDFVQKQLLNASQSTSMAAINFKTTSKITIPLPQLDQQKKIAAILDAADAYRQKTKALIKKYDELTQSLFLDMFGDPVTNPKGWEKKGLSKLGNVVTGSTPPSSKEGMFGGNIPFVTPGDLGHDRPVKRTVTREGAENSRVVRKGSLFLCCIGATIGKKGIARTDSAFNQQINAVEWNELINDNWGLYAFTWLKHEVIERAISTTLPIMKKSEFEKVKVPCPPIYLQNQFAERVQLIEAQKAQAQASLTQAEDLFNSLLQRAFKGELV